MDKQLFISNEKPVEEKFIQPFISPHAPINKPMGGLWTSTFIDMKHGSDWVQWNLSTFHDEDLSFHGWLIEPMNDISVYTINTYQDLDNLFLHYETKLFDDPVFDKLTYVNRIIDYEEVSKSYDAIHLTKRGQAETRLSLPYNLYGWDCQCYLWLNWKIKSVEDIGIRSFNSL